MDKGWNPVGGRRRVGGGWCVGGGKHVGRLQPLALPLWPTGTTAHSGRCRALAGAGSQLGAEGVRAMGRVVGDGGKFDMTSWLKTHHKACAWTINDSIKQGLYVTHGQYMILGMVNDD